MMSLKPEVSVPLGYDAEFWVFGSRHFDAASSHHLQGLGGLRTLSRNVDFPSHIDRVSYFRMLNHTAIKSSLLSLKVFGV